jgi:hypothetical protein
LPVFFVVKEGQDGLEDDYFGSVASDSSSNFYSVEHYVNDKITENIWLGSLTPDAMVSKGRNRMVGVRVDESDTW